MTMTEGCGPTPNHHADFQDRLASVAAEFVASLPERVRHVSEAIASGDVKTAREELHKLVGGGGTCGHMAVSELAADALRLVKQGGLDEASSKAEQLARLAEQIQPHGSC